MIITHRDMRRLGYCNSGAREFFKRHNLDWSEFVTNGVSAEILLATGDAMAIRVVEQAKEKN